MSHRARIALATVCLALAAGVRPAHAVWGPDSVLFLGSGLHGTINAQFLPTGAGDLETVWRWTSNSGAGTSAARVTRDGGLVFSRQLSSTTLQGVALDGSTGIFDAWSIAVNTSNSDVAFEHVAADGSRQPPAANYWAAQTPAKDIAPAMTPDGTGGAYVAWWTFPTQNNCYLQRVTPAGTVAAGWPAAGRRLLGAFQWPPAVLADGSGGAYVLTFEDVARLWRVQPDTTLAPGWAKGGVALESGPSIPASASTYPYDVALVPSGADHVFAVWGESDPNSPSGLERLLVQWVSSSGGVEWSPVEIVPLSPGLSFLVAESDGQDGLFVTYRLGNVFQVAHVRTDAGFTTTPADGASFWGAICPTHGGGFILFSAGDGGVLASWRLADGSLDPSEPPTPRLVHANTGDHRSRPQGATSDGDGGAFLVLEDEILTYTHDVYMRHVFRSGVLGVPAPHAALLSLAIAPNPARAELGFTCTLASAANARLEVYDLAGRQVLSHELGGGAAGTRGERVALPTGITPGVYLARLSQQGNARVRRFVVTR